MLNKLFLFIALLIFPSVSAYAQNQQIAGVYHDVHKINSKILNEEKSIWVRVPLNYRQTSGKFSVANMIAGHAPQPSMMVGIIE